jgi:YesN/AraC family two-component response regulator
VCHGCNCLLTPNYKVIKAYDGKEGWETAVNLIPDIIISDVMMPEIDGYQLTAKLKEDPRTNHIPIILLTARAAQEDKVKGLEGGADAYLTKPFHEKELMVRINKLIETRRKLQESFAQNRFLKPSVKAQGPFLVDLFGILEKNYQDEDFGIHELAAALHMSRMQVHRKLKALTNYSTSQLLNSFRLEKGKALLADKDLTISETAYSCGFGDPGYFSKLFVKKYGLNPQAYRKQLN